MYASVRPQQQCGGGGYAGVPSGSQPASAYHAHQRAQPAAQDHGNGGARGGSAEAKRPLEGQYPGGNSGGR